MPDTKTTGLDAITSIAGADVLYVVDDPSGTPVAKKITRADLGVIPTQTLTDGANIDWDVSLGDVAKVTLAGNRTMNAPTNLKDGGTYVLRVIQDGSGSRTITWNAVFKWPAGTAPTLSTGAAAIDLITFVSDGTNLYGSSQLNFS